MPSDTKNGTFEAIISRRQRSGPTCRDYQGATDVTTC